MKAKHIPLIASLALAAALTGCNHPVTNFTLPQTAENQSHLYTLSVNARANVHNMIDGSLKAFVIIDGDEHEMALAPYGDNLFQYDYQMPADRAVAKYYFSIRYKERVGEIIKDRELRDPEGQKPYVLNVVNRYVLAMETTRGPVGSVVPVVGSGFSPIDRIVIGGSEAPTHFASTNAITFTVPPMASGDYPVEWHSGTDVTPVGAFHVDMADLKITPATFELSSGGSTQVTFDIGLPAPEGGVPVSVLTDIPASIIMPEIVIPAGESSVTVKITGGAVALGSLHVSAPGFNQAVVPVKITEAVVMPMPMAEPAPVVVPTPAPEAPVVAPAPVTPAPTPAPAPVPAVMGS